MPETTDLPPALIVAGPTASGKSALALGLAERLRGTVVNADSMQVYRELRVLSARPSREEEARVPHALYGVRPAAEPGHVAWWRGAALAAMLACVAQRRLPILCGGSGLYLAALTDGLSAIPDPTPAARREARGLLDELGAAGLHARLAEVDTAAAARLRPSDGQRIARAWEVWRSTGRSLAAWQDRRGDPAPFRFAAILLDPPRATQRPVIARRFGAMLAEGALEEVRALLALGLDPRIPAMRAVGVRELAAHLRGQATMAEAAARAVLATGRLAKRQATWFRHHALAPPGRACTICASNPDMQQFSERISANLSSFVRGAG
ncbi:MAG: tRNA (adenosine(37)-N6)-dimethylallyltransferase MiaA [Acidisphaera sp.]|nr:tRNA (adenosine(37)-N6)-dimethylallyltransferase MiaA [Acidisphaera sp.]